MANTPDGYIVPYTIGVRNMQVIPLSQKCLLAGLLLLLCLVGGAVLRLHSLGAQPYWMDEGYTINAVTALERTGTDILDSGVRYSCPLYCQPTAWLASTLGDNAFSYRILAALAGIVFIAIIFLITADLFAPSIATLATFFTAFSYFQIAWSRQARWYTLFELFFWPALYFFYKSWYGERRRALYGTLTILFTIATVLTHSLGLILPFIFAGWIIIDTIFISKKISSKNLLLPLVTVIASSALIVFFAYPAIRSLANNLGLHYEFPYYATFYFRSYWLMLILALVLLWRMRQRYTKQILFLIFVLLCYLVPLSLFTNLVQYRYLFHLTPILFILASLGTFELVALCSRTYQKSLVVLAVLGLFFATGEGVLFPRSTFFLESDNPATLPSRSSYLYVPQPDWNGAYAFIKAHRTPSDIVISSMPQFNKIFLDEAGYWIEYDYIGLAVGQPQITEGREAYVGAQVLASAAELASTTANQRGFLVLDYMALNRISPEERAHIETRLKQVFYKKTNDYSQIWVYEF